MRNTEQQNRTSISPDKLKIQEKTALLDKLQLSNIKILHINNVDNLVNRQILETSNALAKYITPSGQVFTKLCIENDGIINKLIAGSTIKGGKKIDYCYLQTNINDSETGNLCCYNVGQYWKYLETK